jgi:SAM-dependent methyltransferase
MRDESYRRLSQRQDHYWYHRARRRLAVNLLRHYGLAGKIRALDVGCGAGGNLSIFREFNAELVVGSDISPIALELASTTEPRPLLVRADVNEQFPFRDATFDVVTIFDVLYHEWVDKDDDALLRVRNVMRPRGLLLVTEPAFKVLSRSVDRATMGKRRYSGAELCRMARRAGLEPLFVSYFLTFAFPIALASALLGRLPRIRNGADHREYAGVDFRALPPKINEALFRLALYEAKLIEKGIRMPFGVGLVGVFQRPL